ncbi:hypothetical protein [Fimbriiglobus ruber]|uniref:Uncharacterized protein n=1 Tax=Fimbriiglobus ruber TaxID=1908690 RepID=A0A225DKK3_9BACT|nr:hypothetical protein [Fimbriiglobus ruber]OWK34797.1 hypothetical protein FRUB_09639 [Fimbriiglobus ruber]OWK39108.1 hypothetical protein FRUB_06190 [Fimbriiglobus ruber]OWK39496.1 hypothetical protein FRUB_06059 [Fimbriiglobus ruber]
MVIDGDVEASALQLGAQDGEAKQFVESSFESRHLLGQVGTEKVPEGLVLDVGVKSFDRVRE